MGQYEMNRRVCRRLIAVLLTCYWSALFLGTHVPKSGVHLGIGNDKLLHFGAFAGLAFLLSWSLIGLHPTRRATVRVIVIVVVYAALDEWTQWFVPHRRSDIYDWWADVFGALAGMVAYAVSLTAVREWRWRAAANRRRASADQLPVTPIVEAD
jgi:VanZ family protein